MTQTIFAAYMGVSNKTVEAWEHGTKHPSGSALRLLDMLAVEDLEQTKFIIQD